MSALRATESVYDGPQDARPPYRRGDRVCATSPEGIRYQIRVESITPTDGGQFALVGAVRSPRRYRSHLLSTLVGPDGFGPAIRPVAVPA